MRRPYETFFLHQNEDKKLKWAKTIIDLNEIAAIFSANDYPDQSVQIVLKSGKLIQIKETYKNLNSILSK